MEQYKVGGMSCDACRARVEKAVSKVPGVESCSVSLLTETMGVTGQASSDDIINAVEKAGYTAEIMGGASRENAGRTLRGTSENTSKNVSKTNSKKVLNSGKAEKPEIKALKKRLISSVIITLILMYFSMGHSMLGFYVPKFIDNYISLGIVQMILAGIVIKINEAFFTKGIRGLVNLYPNMDTLVALGSGISYIYSIYILFKAVDYAVTGGNVTGMMMEDEYGLYFESSAMILTLITVGKLLEAKAKGKTLDALENLINIQPDMATVIRDGKEVRISAADMRVGEEFVVKPGEKIPGDGRVIKGEGYVDESMLTGEPMPARKKNESKVFAGTINTDGYITCILEKEMKDSALSGMIALVEEAAITKAPIARIADKVSAVFVPVIILLAVGTFIVWKLLGTDTEFSLIRGISVLVISCPCALGLATPVAIMVGNGVGANHRILFKSSEAMETVGKSDVIFLDKTGTLTKGKPEVIKVRTVTGSEEDLLKKAYTIEKMSVHPLAKAVVNYCKDKINIYDETGNENISDEISNENISDETGNENIGEFKDIPGYGVIYGDLFAGNIRHVKKIIKVNGKSQIKKKDKNSQIRKELEKLSDIAEKEGERGRTLIIFGEKADILGYMIIADEVRSDSIKAVEIIKNMGIKVVMLTGDNKKTGEYIGKITGVDEVYAGILPEDKYRIVEEYKNKEYIVTMVGDGINDAPALKKADVGIAIGAGTDVAKDAADIVVVGDSIMDVASAVKLSRATIRNIKENLFWAFCYNVICIPLAMGVYGINMKPMYGALAMSMSSFCVCMNALRLNFVKLYKRDDINDSEDSNRNNSGDVNSNNGEDSNRNNSGDSNRNNSGDNDKDNNKNDIKQNSNINKDKRKENNTMEKEIKIEGMMCGHCEATVKKALENIEGVKEAKVSHEKGNAVVTLEKEVDNAVLEQAVTDKDYKVLSID